MLKVSHLKVCPFVAFYLASRDIPNITCCSCQTHNIIQLSLYACGVGNKPYATRCFISKAQHRTALANSRRRNSGEAMHLHYNIFWMEWLIAH